MNMIGLQGVCVLMMRTSGRVACGGVKDLERHPTCRIWDGGGGFLVVRSVCEAVRRAAVR